MNNNIRTIAPLLANHFIDIEDDSDFEGNKLSTEKTVRLGRFHNYIGFLHDSWIIKTDIAAGKFSLLLNDFTTHVFSDALIEKKELNVDHDKLVFPIQIDFNILNLSFNNVDEMGNIRIIDPTNTDEYLGEQIISVNDDFIEVGLIVWKKNKNGPGESILVLINAKDIALTELQENAWKTIFDNKYLDYYNYFKSQFELGRYVQIK